MTSSSDFWSILPESIWLKIFTICGPSDLLAIKDVCHQWRRIAKDFTLISRLDLRSISRPDFRYPSMASNLVDLLSFAANDLRSVKLKNMTIMQILSKNSSNEPLSHSSISEDVWIQLRDNCNQLKRLLVENMSHISYTCLPKGLTHLSIGGNSHCIDFYVTDIPLGCHKCETVFGTDSIFDLDLIDCDNKLQSIVYLNICHKDVFESKICPSLNRFQSLKYLYLEGLYRINSWGVVEVQPQLMSQLVVLDLEATDIDDMAFKYILDNAMSLEELYLGRTRVKGEFDVSKSVAKCLKVLCLLNTKVETNDLLSILRFHSSLELVNCDEEVTETIGSTVLKTDITTEFVHDFLCTSCQHYIHDNRFDRT